MNGREYLAIESCVKMRTFVPTCTWEFSIAGRQGQSHGFKPLTLQWSKRTFAELHKNIEREEERDLGRDSRRDEMTGTQVSDPAWQREEEGERARILQSKECEIR